MIFSTFSADWRTYTFQNGDVWQSGIFKYNCKAPKSGQGPQFSKCGKYWWQNQKGWEKVVVIFQVTAVGWLFLSLASTIFSWFHSLRQKVVIFLLMVTSALCTVFLGLSVMFYTFNNIGLPYHERFLENVSVGYGLSFWLALLSWIYSIFTTFIVFCIFLSEFDLFAKSRNVLFSELKEKVMKTKDDDEPLLKKQSQLYDHYRI
ncbi:unnamed protein product, partial [Mesorhabditis belari]|uniref:Uncharacterized protein n=1 Tax=Mesorhabditis belari TaxID=2138241 RepID=A0AAF3FCA9_9BILA